MRIFTMFIPEVALATGKNSIDLREITIYNCNKKFSPFKSFSFDNNRKMWIAEPLGFLDTFG